MSAKIKVFVGAALLLPAVLVWLYTLSFRFDNPHLTETELFLHNGWAIAVVAVLAAPGSVLMAAGIRDYQDPDQ